MESRTSRRMVSPPPSGKLRSRITNRGSCSRERSAPPRPSTAIRTSQPRRVNKSAEREPGVIVIVDNQESWPFHGWIIRETANQESRMSPQQPARPGRDFCGHLTELASIPAE